LIFDKRRFLCLANMDRIMKIFMKIFTKILCQFPIKTVIFFYQNLSHVSNSFNIHSKQRKSVLNFLFLLPSFSYRLEIFKFRSYNVCSGSQICDQLFLFSKFLPLSRFPKLFVSVSLFYSSDLERACSHPHSHQNHALF